jgi:glycosyltransferase involved in cell wall biosynthesis
MKIVFYLGPAFERWSPITVDRDGAGGSEIMAVDLARGLSADGHEVVLYSDCDGHEGFYDGVRYESHRRYSGGIECDVFVAWRTPWALDRPMRAKSRVTLFSAHDGHYGSELTLARTEGVHFVVVSNYHRQSFLGFHGATVMRKNTTVISNSIRADRFAILERLGVGPREHARLIHTSAPNRSLRAALSAMPKIRGEVPEATLHVYHGFLTLKEFARERKDLGMLAEMESMEGMLERTPPEGIVYHGRQSQTEVAWALLNSTVWVYPTATAETFCLAALEAQAAGCEIVSVDMGALKEVTRGARLLDVMDEDAYVNEVVSAIRHPRTEQLKLWAEAARYAFDVRHMVSSYEELIRRLLEETPEKKPAKVFVPSRSEDPRNGKICLAMIVKNESHIIAETLTKVRHLIDEWLIIDTGSTDDTRAAIESVMKDTPGEILDRPWVSFGYNRSELLLEARRRKTEWLLLLDADCDVETELSREELRRRLPGYDQYLVNGKLGGVEYAKLFIVRASLPWHYEMPTHEWLYCDGPMRYTTLSGVTVVERGTSSRRLSGKKALEDIEMLSAYLADLACPHRARATFYLAMSHRDAGHREEAIRYFLDRSKMMESPGEEAYVAALYAARLMEEREGGTDNVLTEYSRAIMMRPQRHEARLALARLHRAKGEHATSVALSRSGLLIGRPSSDQLFVEVDAYDWKLKDELAVSLSWIDSVETRTEAHGLFTELLALSSLPDAERERIRGGRRFCEEMLSRSAPEKKLLRPKIRIVSPPTITYSAAVALDDVADILVLAARGIGYRVERGLRAERGFINIIVGAHVMDWDANGEPGDSIIYQTEVWSSPWWPALARYRGYVFWDYSEINARHYRDKLGMECSSVVPLGYAPGMATLEHQAEKPIDVLFYGSLNTRRCAVIDELTGRGLKVRAESRLFGEDRKKAIEQAKIVVNIHYYEDGPAAQSRLVYLLANRVPVVSEMTKEPGDKWLDDAIQHRVAYEHLARECECLVKSDQLRELAARRGADVVMGKPMGAALELALESFRLTMPKPEAISQGAESTGHSTTSEYIESSRLVGGALVSVPDRLNLGCADAHIPGYQNVDLFEPADLIADLSEPWPWPASSVREIRAHDFIEHLADKIHTMNEAHRVLMSGGLFDIVVPTTDGRGAFQDPDHRSFWNRNSFWYFEAGNLHRERYGKAYGITARFQVLSEHEAVTTDKISVLKIRLVAVKPPTVIVVG